MPMHRARGVQHRLRREYQRNRSPLPRSEINHAVVPTIPLLCSKGLAKRAAPLVIDFDLDQKLCLGQTGTGCA